MKDRLRRLLLEGLAWTAALALLAFGVLVVEAGFDLRGRPELRSAVEWADLALVVLVGLDLAGRLWVRGPKEYVRARWLDLLLYAAAVALLAAGVPRGAGGVLILRQTVVLGRRLSETAWARAAAQHVTLRPLQILALSYAAAITVGTFLLLMPAATPQGNVTDFTTALFTATSAVCVTGLIVVDTGSHFAPFGQVVILVLIQLGGLGIMTLSAALTLLLRGGLGLRPSGLMRDILGEESVAAFREVVTSAVLVTAVVEVVGVLVLWGRFAWTGIDVGRAAWLAAFHSISAFCNAGFSVWDDSLMGWVGDPVVNLVMAGLIILGGLGFGVVLEVWRLRVRGRPAGGRADRRRPAFFHRRLSVHTRMVLWGTAALLVFGWVAIFHLEYARGLSDLGTGEKLLAAFFQSATLRTAGFNSVDFSTFGAETLVLVMAFMFIGGAPGSTAGGIKVTTAIVLGLSVRTLLTGRRDVEVWSRTVPPLVVYRSVAVAFISFLLVVAFLGVLLRTQDLPFLEVAFETVSAFGTVGLSIGATPKLDVLGRLLVVVLMFIGRTGPLTFALAVAERPRGGRFGYPEERVLVG